VQPEAIDLMFDLDFPGADDTQIELVGRIFTGRQGSGGELLGTAIQPQEGMRIQQQFHGVPLSQKASGSGASKSGLIHILPRCWPKTRFLGAELMGTNFTFGWLSWAITISSPCSAKSMSSRRCPAASWTVTIFSAMLASSLACVVQTMLSTSLPRAVTC